MKEWIRTCLEEEPAVTDLHLTEGGAVFLRCHGILTRGSTLSDPLLVALRESLSEAAALHLAQHGACDGALDAGGRRCRFHLYRSGSRLAAAIRILAPLSALPPDRDGPWIRRIASLRAGLVLITGATGSGKSTTLAHLIQTINESRPCHIVTVEDPVEYLFPSDQALIHQREVGADAESFAAGVREALREDPDVVVIGEMRDGPTMAAALTAAETGHLVLATMHSRTAPEAIGRMVHAFPGGNEEEIRLRLAASLRSIASQALFRSGGKTWLLREILVNLPAVAHLIREGRDGQIPSYMEMGTAGMRTWKQAAGELCRERTLTEEDKEALHQFLEG